MKNFIAIIFSAIFILSFQSCSSQAVMDSASVDALVSSKEFSFNAVRANPSAADGYNVINNIPNGGSRLLQLNTGEYGLDIVNDKIESALPYFGRSFSNDRSGQDNSGYRFTSKDFVMNQSKNKKGNYVITIQPKDINYVRTMILEVFKNGRATLSIDSNQRQPISYDGYITKKESVMK